MKNAQIQSCVFRSLDGALNFNEVPLRMRWIASILEGVTLMYLFILFFHLLKWVAINVQFPEEDLP